MLMNNLRNFPPVTLGIFQSTLLQEERLFTFVPVALSLIFQSTLLQEERHCSLSSKIYSSIISIHAPTRGATQPCYWIILHLLFQSTLLQEERQSVCTQELNATIFQSTLLQEERPCTGRICLDNRLFQSTLLQEERRIRR